jgi:hypothetical protein
MEIISKGKTVLKINKAEFYSMPHESMRAERLKFGEHSLDGGSQTICREHRKSVSQVLM